MPPHDVAEIDKIASPPKGSGLLYQIPQWIDSLPTVLPEESANEPDCAPCTDLTEERTWVDRQQKEVRNWADRTAMKMDNLVW